MGVPRSVQRFFFAPYMEFEYGVTGRWTSGLYLFGVSREMLASFACGPFSLFPSSGPESLL